MKRFRIGKRIVGELHGDTYVKHVNSKKHWCTMGRGYAISNSIIKQLKERRCEKVVIIEQTAKGTNKYVVPFEKYANACILKLGGFEQQRCVPLVEMTKL